MKKKTVIKFCFWVLHFYLLAHLLIIAGVCKRIIFCKVVKYEFKASYNTKALIHQAFNSRVNLRFMVSVWLLVEINQSNQSSSGLHNLWVIPEVKNLVNKALRLTTNWLSPIRCHTKYKLLWIPLHQQYFLSISVYIVWNFIQL